MRFDLNTLIHFDGHFLSDTVNPWVALQLHNQSLPEKILVFVYRLSDGAARKSFRLIGLDLDTIYNVINDDDASASPPTVPGSELHFSGLTVDLPRPNSAAIIVLRAIK